MVASQCSTCRKKLLHENLHGRGRRTLLAWPLPASAPPGLSAAKRLNDAELVDHIGSAASDLMPTLRTNFSGLTSSIYALASAAAKVPMGMVSLERCMAVRRAL